MSITYHATWSFFGLKGIIAERWAHGPTFGAVTEVGTRQLNLSPPEDDDEQIMGIVGVRTSGLIAEGDRTAEVADLAPRWFEDIISALKPQVVVSVGVEVFGLHPLRDPWRASERLRSKYYRDGAIEGLAGEARMHSAVEVLDSDGTPMRTIILGVVGPPHRGSYFTFPDKTRDDSWWMGLRLNYAETNDEGLLDPLERLERTRQAALAEWHRIGLQAFPPLIA